MARSTSAKSRSAHRQRKNPFRYGWRYVPKTLPDGTETFEQVPLTLEDVLHPQEEDCIPEHPYHEWDCRYLHDVADSRLANNPRALTFCDCLINWGVEGLRPHSPDISVFFVPRRKRRRLKGTFYVVREKARSILAIEVTSLDTRRNDLKIKVKHYHRARVPLYIIVDRLREEGPPRLIGYRYTAARYVRMTPDERGRLLLEPLGVWLGVRDNRVVCYDAATDKELGDYTAIQRALETETDARKAAEMRAQEEAAARRAAEQREQEEATARRAAEQRAAAVETRLQELEEQLRRRRNGSK
jgi:Uma2 family endonuclease